MADNPWWQSAVIYQIYPRSFQDDNGDGIGDLRGITRRIPYLVDVLGVDAIWISPFYSSPMADFGYDVSDYCDVDPRFGTLDDFDSLMAAAHERGLRVIVDFVPNHTSHEHPWFQEALADPDSDRRDWYVFRDPKPDGSRPNNWLSIFGGPAWEWHEGSKQFYLHTFLPEQPDLNWRNPDVKRAMLDVLTFWLKRGVDGFRIDAAHIIMKDPELRDNPPNPGPKEFHKGRGEYDEQLHIHDLGHPDVHKVFGEMRKLLDEFDAGRRRVGIGEIHEYDVAKWVEYYGKSLDGLHMPFNFALLNVQLSADGVRSVVEAMESALPEGAWPNYVLGNHDESRLASRFGPDKARLAAVLLLTLRGTPTLYYGDELGMLDVDIPLDKQQDPWGLRVPELGLSRDPARTPMRWDTSVNAGFSAESAEPWLPLGEVGKCNVESQLNDPTSMLSLYRKLIAFRREHSVLQRGALRIQSGPDDTFTYWRGEDVCVAINFGSEPRSIALDFPAKIELVTGGELSTEPTQLLELSAHQAAILRRV